MKESEIKKGAAFLSQIMKMENTVEMIWEQGEKLRAPFWNIVSETSMNPKEGLVKEEVGVSGPETEMQRSSAQREQDEIT